MKKLISKLRIIGLILFGISIALSSCKALTPIPNTGSFMFTDNITGSTEIIDPVCGRTIELPQDDLVWQFEGRNYYFFSSECLDLFKMAPENYIKSSPKKHRHTANNNAFTLGFWGAAAGAMMLIMLL